MSKEEWLNRYLFTDEHDIFFCSFPCELHEWLSKLADSEDKWNLNSPIVWTRELVKCLEASKNKIVWDIDYWIDRIMGRFITEFAINMSTTYSEVKHRFFKGPRVKYLKCLKTSIKMLLCEKQVIPLN